MWKIGPVRTCRILRSNRVPLSHPGYRTGACFAYRRKLDAFDDAVAYRADALDGQFHHVPRAQRRRVVLSAATPQLGQAAAVAAGTGAEHVPGPYLGTARGVTDEFLERPAHVGQQVLPGQLAVDRRAQVEREEAVGVPVAFEFVRGDQPGAKRSGEVLALGRPEMDAHLAALQVPGRPVVQHGVAENVLPCLLR